MIEKLPKGAQCNGFHVGFNHGRRCWDGARDIIKEILRAEYI
jgi:hypothetical protein